MMFQKEIVQLLPANKANLANSVKLLLKFHRLSLHKFLTLWFVTDEIYNREHFVKA